MARTSIPMNDGERRIIRARVGSKDDFPMGEKDYKAVLRATEIIKYRIKKEFPLHFED
jgi:hypothetical protein